MPEQISKCGFVPAALLGFSLRIALDFDADTRLIGLKNFAPKSWADRFREIQQANGRVEVRSMRIKQGDLLAVASGSLKLTPIRLSRRRAAGDRDRSREGPGGARRRHAARRRRRNERIGAALSFLDKLAPGAVTGVM